jgi:uncharacterized damage-inducible protein DinB
MTAVDLNELYTHMEWADQTVWDAVLSSSSASADESVFDTLLHVHATQRAFLHLWQRVPIAIPKPSEFDSAAGLRSWASDYYAEAKSVLESLSEDDLGAVVEIPWAHLFTKRFGRPPELVTVEQTAYQVVAHTQYHRGQVNRRLRELGSEPPLVDYIAWLWLGRPTPGLATSER